MTRLEVGVVTGVGVASDVAHPHVIAAICQDVGQTLVGQVSEPVRAGAQ